MKFNTLILVACSLLSFTDSNPSPSDTNILSMSDLIEPVVINEHLHHSLPADWISEYRKIITNLKNLLPLNQIYYHSIDIYAWIVEIYLTSCRELCLMIKSADRLRAALTNSPKSEKSQIENRSSHAYSNNQFQS